MQRRAKVLKFKHLGSPLCALSNSTLDHADEVPSGHYFDPVSTSAQDPDPDDDDKTGKMIAEETTAEEVGLAHGCVNLVHILERMWASALLVFCSL